MQYARVLIAIFIVASNVATGASNASRPVAGSALAAVAAVGAATGAERIEVAGIDEIADAPVVGVDYPSVQVNAVTIHAPSDAGLAQGRAAVLELASHGFELPAVDVYVHATRHGCSRAPGDLQRSGVYIQRAEGDVVHACALEFTLYHELAHVWDVAVLSDHQREAFLERRDAEYWSGPEWKLAAGEHAANVIAWAMLDGAVRPSQTLPNDDASLQAAYELLVSYTG